MISIIIPTLNEENAIEKTLQNLKEIKNFSYEIIVSDGGSKDRTVEIAKKYTDKVIIYTGEKRQTIGGGRNLGTLSAEGEYLMFVDSDVFIPDINNFLDTILVEFNKNKKLLSATARLLVIKENETLADKFFSAVAINWPHYLCNNILHTSSASGEFQFIRKDCFLNLGGYDESLTVGEDNELFWRIAKLGKTKMFFNLNVYHTGRRFHKLGWVRILWLWTSNLVYIKFLKKSTVKEWKPVR